MINVFDNLAEISDEQCQRLFEELPKSRKEKALTFDGNKRKIAVAEYFELKKLLKLKENCDFSYNENGKPLLFGHHFNISHCDDVVCIAVSETPVGVDMEKTRKYDERFAQYILNDDELAFIEKQQNKDQAITKLWTQKEATIKCLGLSMSTPLKNIIDDKRFTYSFQQYKEYYICECTFKKQHLPTIGGENV